MDKKKRSDMPNKKIILNHWANRLIEDGKYWMDVIYDDEPINIQTSYCFACGSCVGTERAHIIPLDNNGTNKVENLHLLCKECHIESESVSSLSLYKKWFSSKNPSNSGSMLRLLNLVKLHTNE